MTDVEVTLAMAALRQAWAYVPMADVQARQFQRLFAGYRAPVVRDVLDDLIRLGCARPGPAEMGELLRVKAGLSPGGTRVRNYGRTLADDGWRDGEVPANQPGWREAAADAKRRLKGSTEAERVHAAGVIERERAESEAAAPDWWGTA